MLFCTPAIWTMTPLRLRPGTPKDRRSAEAAVASEASIPSSLVTAAGCVRGMSFASGSTNLASLDLKIAKQYGQERNRERQGTYLVTWQGSKTCSGFWHGKMYKIVPKGPWSDLCLCHSASLFPRVCLFWGRNRSLFLNILFQIRAISRALAVYRTYSICGEEGDQIWPVGIDTIINI